MAKKLNKVEGVESNIVVFGSNNEISDSSKKIGGDTIAASPDSSTVATELGVRNAIDQALQWTTIGE